ncbi:hypothetical protein D3C79_558830 [compost metagenome]
MPQINRQIAPAQAHAALYRPGQRQLFLRADGNTHRVLATGVSTAGMQLRGDPILNTFQIRMLQMVKRMLFQAHQMRLI